jgi:hypothetical protein
MKIFRVFKKLKKDKVVICRVSDLLKAGFDQQIIMNGMIRVNESVWDGITDQRYIWTDEMLRSQFRICPDLIFCAFENGQMTATASGFFTTEADLDKYKSWLEKTGNGYFTRHNTTGNVGFGADLSVTRDASTRTSNRLMLSFLFEIIGYELKALYLGSRIPSYHKHRQMPVEDYVYAKRQSGKPLDPEIYFYLKDGFEIVEIIPDYMDDPESLNYGVLIRWNNPLYRVTKILPFLRPIIQRAARAFLLRIPDTIKDI